MYAAIKKTNIKLIFFFESDGLPSINLFPYVVRLNPTCEPQKYSASFGSELPSKPNRKRSSTQ